MNKKIKNPKQVAVAILCFIIALFSMNVSAQKTYHLASPDGKLRTTISVGDQITYTLSHGTTGILNASPVSMTLESGEVLGKSPKGVKIKLSGVNRTVPSPFYKKSEVTENYNELALTFNGNYGLIFRAYNEGLAYRFVTSRKSDLIIAEEEFTLNFQKDFMTYAAYSVNGEGSFENINKMRNFIDVNKLINIYFLAQFL